jgi:DNA-binding NarL/FixJ family response regulator
VTRDYPIRLSSRESEVLQLMARGVPDNIIANALEIKPSTVRTYIARLRTKFQVVNRAQLGAIAARLGYADEDNRMVV